MKVWCFFSSLLLLSSPLLLFCYWLRSSVENEKTARCDPVKMPLLHEHSGWCVCVCVWYLVCELTWKLKSSLKREVLSVDRSGNSENQQRHFFNFNLSKWHIRSHTQQQHIVHTYARRLSVFVVFVSALKSISGPRNWFIHYWTFRHRIVRNKSSSFRSFLVYQKRNVVTRAPFRFELFRCFLPFSTVFRFFHFNNIVNIDFSEVQRKKVCNTKTEKFAY